MKKSNIIGIAFFIIATFVIGWRLSESYKIVPKDSIVVSQVTIDSLDAYIALADSLEILAHLPPDTVYKDSIIYEEVAVYVETTPVPTVDPEDTTLIVYNDTLYIKDTVHAWVQYKVRGYVEGTAIWGFNRIIEEKTETIEKTVPYPVIKNVEVPKMVTGNYISLATGGNDKMFIFGVDYDMVKPNYIAGLQYRRFGNTSIYGVKIGINLNGLYNKIRNGP